MMTRCSNRNSPQAKLGLPRYVCGSTHGFVGFEKDYRCKELFIPHKKPKQQELTAEQKATNKVLAKERIVVEHSIAGLKRYRILSDRLRLHDLDLYNQILGVCAGLWNFKLSC